MKESVHLSVSKKSLQKRFPDVSSQHRGRLSPPALHKPRRSASEQSCRPHTRRRGAGLPAQHPGAGLGGSRVRRGSSARAPIAAPSQVLERHPESTSHAAGAALCTPGGLRTRLCGGKTTWKHAEVANRCASCRAKVPERAAPGRAGAGQAGPRQGSARAGGAAGRPSPG